MKVVDVVQARADLDGLLREVEAGEEVLIERDGKAVARLVKQTIKRTPGLLAQYPEWKDWEYDASIFAPLDTDEDFRAEGIEP